MFDFDDLDNLLDLECKELDKRVKILNKIGKQSRKKEKDIPETDRVRLPVTEELLTKVITRCSLLGVTLSDVLTTLVREYAYNNRKKEVKNEGTNNG